MVLGFSGMIPNFLAGLISLIFLVAAAEVVVKKMEGVAKHYGISEVVIAMTIVSIGTSLPEITIHLVASTQILLSSGAPIEIFGTGFLDVILGSHTEMMRQMLENNLITESKFQTSQELFLQKSGTVIGASIGSDVVQETLVVGLVIISSAMMAGKKGFKFSRKFLIRDYAPMVGTTLITLVLALNWQGLTKIILGGTGAVSGTLTRLDGIVLVSSFVAYMLYLYSTRKESLASQGDVSESGRPLKDLFLGLVAMAVVVGSADFFLRVVEVAVKQKGLSGSMIGVATVGIVSAFPEMITAISGLRHGSEAISLGTLVGSNITNPLLAIGSGAILSTYAVPRPVILWDLPMEIILAGLPVLYMFKRNAIGNQLSIIASKIGLKNLSEKLEASENQVLSIAGAIILILLYFMYLYIRFTYFPQDFA